MKYLHVFSFKLCKNTISFFLVGFPQLGDAVLVGVVLI